MSRSQFHNRNSMLTNKYLRVELQRQGVVELKSCVGVKQFSQALDQFGVTTDLVATVLRNTILMADTNIITQIWTA